jgi:hypothetical protein
MEFRIMVFRKADPSFFRMTTYASMKPGDGRLEACTTIGWKLAPQFLRFACIEWVFQIQY